MTDQTYPADFESAWKTYPRRPGNSKRAAYIQWKRRIKEGADPDLMIRGTAAYAAYCEAQGTTGTNLVKMASTFYGPGWHFEAYTEEDARVEEGKADPGAGDLMRFYDQETII